MLASASPRRKQLLEQVGIEFEIVCADVDESLDENQSAEDNATRIACLKAKEVYKQRPQSFILAADTMVVVDETILGKPADESDAKRMIQLLSDRTHEVITGFALMLPSGETVTDSQTTRVNFRKIDNSAIDWYIESYTPMDKAGAYGIQDGMARYIQRIEGCFYNVMGLPISSVCKLLEKLGVI